MISRFIKVYDGRRSDFAPISPKIQLKKSWKIEIWVIQPQMGFTYAHTIPMDTFQQKKTTGALYRERSTTGAAPILLRFHQKSMLKIFST